MSGLNTPFPVDSTFLSDVVGPIFNPSLDPPDCFALGLLTELGLEPSVPSQVIKFEGLHPHAGDLMVFGLHGMISPVGVMSTAQHPATALSATFSSDGRVSKAVFGTIEPVTKARQIHALAGIHASFGTIPLKKARQLSEMDSNQAGKEIHQKIEKSVKSNAMITKLQGIIDYFNEDPNETEFDVNIEGIKHRFKRSEIPAYESEIVDLQQHVLSDENIEQAKAQLQQMLHQPEQPARWGCTQVVIGDTYWTPWLGCTRLAQSQTSDLPYFCHDFTTDETFVQIVTPAIFRDKNPWEHEIIKEGCTYRMILKPNGEIVSKIKGSNMPSDDAIKRAEKMLRECNAVLQSKMEAIQWLEVRHVERHEQPERQVNNVFSWIYGFPGSMQMPKPNMIGAHALMPAMSQLVIKRMMPVVPTGSFQAMSSNKLFNPCECTPTRRNPECMHPLCKYKLFVRKQIEHRKLLAAKIADRIAAKSESAKPRVSAKSASAKPVSAKPVSAKPVSAKSASAKSASAKSASAKSASAKPVSAKPASAKPKSASVKSSINKQVKKGGSNKTHRSRSKRSNNNNKSRRCRV